MKLNVHDLSKRAKRALKSKDLQDMYTEDELSAILNQYNRDKPSGFEPFYGMLKEVAKQPGPRLRRRWSPIEDTFLYDTYEYITDATIALALNIPEYEVRRHRVALGLEKFKGTTHYVVWHNRENFDTDMEKYQLNKARSINPKLIDRIETYGDSI
jgi:KaiC/GvpD/RAD55 family RecA-like ATPase